MMKKRLTMNKRDHDMKKSNYMFSMGYRVYTVIYPVSNITQLRTIVSLKSFPDIEHIFATILTIRINSLYSSLIFSKHNLYHTVD